jgi:hypothetical protein
MQDLQFCPRRPFTPDDALIQDMANAFPRLRILDLGTTYGSGGRTNVTLAGLVRLVQHCPALQSLGIVIDTSNTDLLPVSDIKAWEGVSNLKVETMHVGDSRISDPAAVASFLSNIFPNLDTIDTQYYFDDRSTANEKERYKRLWKDTAFLVEGKRFKFQYRHHSTADSDFD